MPKRVPLSHFEADTLLAPEVAQVLGISEKTVRSEAKAGRLPANFIGRRMLFCKERLRRWMAGELMLPSQADNAPPAVPGDRPDSPGSAPDR